MPTSVSVPHRSPDSGGRLIFVDDNVRLVGGHYFELATLLMDAADELGYRPVLATNTAFDLGKLPDLRHQVLPVFRPFRMLRWSLGVDGGSQLPRDLDGYPQGGTAIARTLQRAKDWCNVRQRTPHQMLANWADDFRDFLKALQLTSNDSIVLNTGDDFLLLAAARAMRDLRLPPLRIDVVFHFALTATVNGSETSLRQIGDQVQQSIEQLTPHRVHLHATTRPLANQWRATGLNYPVNPIPYPTRRVSKPTPPVNDSEVEPQALRAVLAGMPRAEKGRSAIGELIEQIRTPFLATQKYELSIQMPVAGWQRSIPSRMRGYYTDSIRGERNGLHVMNSDLSTENYHRWLDTADLGLFLYEPNRYVARCSGVLLEMMARGTPVIVPDRCWLADCVYEAGGNGSIGFIYQDRRDVPRILQEFLDRRHAIQERALEHAAVIQKQHAATNTLRAMGLRAMGLDGKQAKQIAA